MGSDFSFNVELRRKTSAMRVTGWVLHFRREFSSEIIKINQTYISSKGC